jgi:hypothetical protein
MQSLSSGRIGQEQDAVHYVDLTLGVTVEVQCVLLSNGRSDSRYISLTVKYERRRRVQWEEAMLLK